MIVNPAARRAARALAGVAQEIGRVYTEVRVLRTEAPGHAALLARENAPHADVFFSLGGDGTAMETISGLAGTGIPVGILPGGTGNILVRSLRIPTTPRRAVRALLGGERVRLDVGRLADGRRFAIGVGVGVDASMILQATAQLKRRFGIFAYVVAGVRALLRLDRFDVTVTVDGESFRAKATTVLVANFGTLVHDLIVLGSGIRQDDGLLDVCVHTSASVRDVVRIAMRLLRRDFSFDPCMIYRRGRHISVVTDPPRPAQADGELIGLTPLDIHVEPLAATLLVPARYVRLLPRALPSGTVRR